MKRQHPHSVNTEIAVTHLVSRKRQIFTAALGVTVGIGVFIFMNSLMKGFDRYSSESLFKTVPHLRVYREDALSKPLVTSVVDSNHSAVILNPKITNRSKKVVNPHEVMEVIKTLPYVTSVTPDVAVNVFYNNGQAQVPGKLSGVDIQEEDQMFHLTASMLEGGVRQLETRQDGIILGEGIVNKLNVRIGDNITVSSAVGITKPFKVVGIFKTGITGIDKSKAYIHISAAQSLLRQGPSYITDIFVNVKDPDNAGKYVSELRAMTGYDVEDWATANSAAMAANRVRRVMAFSISMSILLVAGFGIYNILNMTIMQKMNDIAILKAMGFSGWDVTRIFMTQALFIGVIGVMLGWGLGAFIVSMLAKVYVGGDIGYFPIRFEPMYFGLATVFGLIVTSLAGFLPARKAARVDPVAILRK
ncbi:MAG: ABC transporter permease [Bacteroidia bacterium]